MAANIKSKLRKQLGMRGRGHRGRKRGRPPGSGNAAVAVLAPRTTSSMLALEDAIEDCIYLARRMESERLVDVIRILKKARNHLIVMTGAK